MMLWDGSQVPISHYGQCFLSFVFTSFIFITCLAPIDSVLLHSALPGFVFPLTAHLLDFLPTFLLPSLRLGSSSVFASLLCLLTSVSMETGTRQGSDTFWVVPVGGGSILKGKEKDSFCTKKWQPCPPLNCAGASQTPFTIPHPLIPVAQVVASCWPLGYYWVLEWQGLGPGHLVLC